MKLLLENEALTRQNVELEKENANLKHRAQIVNNLQTDAEYNVPTIKQAWFVNVPLLKEWVVAIVFIRLLISICNKLQLK